jgi:hypothetical protein
MNIKERMINIFEQDVEDTEWSIDGINTHGIEGQADVGFGVDSTAGISSDDIFVGGIEELFQYIKDNEEDLLGGKFTKMSLNAPSTLKTIAQRLAKRYGVELEIYEE